MIRSTRCSSSARSASVGACAGAAAYRRRMLEDVGLGLGAVALGGFVGDGDRGTVMVGERAQELRDLAHALEDGHLLELPLLGLLVADLAVVDVAGLGEVTRAAGASRFRPTRSRRARRVPRRAAGP